MHYMNYMLLFYMYFICLFCFSLSDGPIPRGCETQDMEKKTDARLSIMEQNQVETKQILVDVMSIVKNLQSTLQPVQSSVSGSDKALGTGNVRNVTPVLGEASANVIDANKEKEPETCASGRSEQW